MAMESTECEQTTNGPITIYRIIQWPADLLASNIPQTYSSLKVIPESSQNPQLFEIAQTRDGIVTSSNLPENPAYLANKILTKIMERRALKKKLHSSFSSASCVCPYCNKSYEHLGHWRRHVNRHTGEVKYPCPLCGKTFLDNSSLSRHKKIHSGEKPWKCKMCGKCFHTLTSLRRHITVHNPAGRPFECEICHKRFPDRSSKQKHVVIHAGLRPHMCRVCNKAFVHIGDLNCHMKIHVDKKEFTCAHCKKEFAKLGNYQRHVKIHEGKKTYKCQLCHISYNFQSSLTRHMLVHQQEKLRKSWIMCRFCDARFSNRSVLKRHLLIHFAETAEQRCQSGLQSNNYISKNDINNRPLTYKEICFVRRNLKYCSIIQLKNSSENDSKNVCNNEEGDYAINNSAKLNSSNESFDSGETGNSRRGTKYLTENLHDKEIVSYKCGSENTMQKKQRGRPKKIQHNPTQYSQQSTESDRNAKLRTEENIVGKRKRGRPRKVVEVATKPVQRAFDEHNKMNQVVEVNFNVAETKRRRGRPRKTLNIVPQENVSVLSKPGKTAFEEHNKTNQAIEVRTDHFAETKRRRGRPRKALNIVGNKIIKIHNAEISDCILMPKRKRGRPRKEVSTAEKMGDSITHISVQNKVQKLKRGRPSKMLHTVPDKDSNHLPSQDDAEVSVNDVSKSVENNNMCKGKGYGPPIHLINTENACEETLRNCTAISANHNCASPEKQTHNGSIPTAELLKVGFLDENAQSKNEDKISNIQSHEKQLQPKHVLHLEGNNTKCSTTYSEQVQGVDIVRRMQTLEGGTGAEINTSWPDSEKKVDRPNEKMHSASDAQKLEQLQELTTNCTKTKNTNTKVGNMLMSTGTKYSGENLCPINTPKDMQALNIGNGNKPSSQRDMQEEAIITDSNLQFINVEGCREDQLSHGTGTLGSSRANEAVYSKKECKQHKLGNCKTCVCLKEAGEMMDVQECNTDMGTERGDCVGRQESQLTWCAATIQTVPARARRDMRDVLLDDWQSDDSCSSGIVWEC